MTKKCLLLFFFLLVETFLFSQTATNSKADSLYRLEKWPEAASLYQKALAKNEGSALWNNFRLGVCQQNLNHYAEAIASYRKTLAVGNMPYAMFNMGLVFATTGQADSAFVWLDKAIVNGFSDIGKLDASTELEKLRKDPRFKPLAVKARKQAFPCEFEPKAREFDFWLGEWNVFNPAGVQAGTSSVQRILGDCVIFENWTNAFGSLGKSFNMYDVPAGIWRQTWVDQNGSWTEFRGQWNGTNMRITTDDITQKDGTQIRRRMTFTPLPDGSVRQHGEASADEGKTWNTEYDLTYRKK